MIEIAVSDEFYFTEDRVACKVLLDPATGEWVDVAGNPQLEAEVKARRAAAAEADPRWWESKGIPDAVAVVESIGTRAEMSPYAMPPGSVEIGPGNARLEAAESAARECPRCGHRGHCDASEHFYFLEGRIALRCRACRHVWADAAGVESPAGATPEDHPVKFREFT